MHITNFTHYFYSYIKDLKQHKMQTMKKLHDTSSSKSV